MKILKHVNSGDLTPDDMKHFTQMYPEVYKYFSKEMTKRITDIQLEKGDPPPYRKRQAMSLFLGAPLDSTFTPEAIQAAQSVYAMKQQAQPTPKMAQANLTKQASSSLTNEQARIRRQQTSKA